MHMSHLNNQPCGGLNVESSIELLCSWGIILDTSEILAEKSSDYTDEFLSSG